MRTPPATMLRAASCLVAASASVCLLAAGGCYERTVSTSGFGSDAVTTHEPNLKTGSNSKAETTTRGKFRWDK